MLVLYSDPNGNEIHISNFLLKILIVRYQVVCILTWNVTFKKKKSLMQANYFEKTLEHVKTPSFNPCCLNCYLPENNVYLIYQRLLNYYT